MKIVNKFKRGILLLALVIGLVLTGYGIKLSVRAAADPSKPTVTYSYAAYTKAAWERYQNVRIIDEDGDCSTTLNDLKDLIARFEALKTTGSEGNKKKKFWTEGDGKRFSGYIQIPQLPDGSYDEESEDIDWDTIVSRGSTNDDIYNALKAEVAAIETKLAEGAVTKLVPGSDVVIAAYATSSSSQTIWNIQVVLDIKDIIQSGSTKYYGNPVADNKTCFNACKDTTYGPMLGAAYTVPGDDLGNPAFLGAVGFKVSNTATTTTVQYKKGVYEGQNIFADQSMTSTINRQNYPNNFEENTIELKGATVSNRTDLTKLTVETKDALTGATGPTYKGSTITDGTADVSIAVAEEGTIDSTGYVYTSAPTLTTSATAPAGSTGTVTISAGDFSYSMNSVTAGNSVWVAFKAIASDGVTFKWYAVELPKAMDTNCDLEAVEIKATVSGASKTLLSETSSLTTTTDFTVHYPKGTTNLNSFTIKPTFTSPKTATVAGAAATSNAVIPISAVSNGGSVTIVVKAQDTSKEKTYKFTFVEVDTTPISVKGISGPSSNLQTKNANYDAPSQKFTIDDMALGRDSFWLNVTLPSGASAELYNSDKTTKIGNITSGSNTSTVSYPSTKNDEASTKTVWIKVTKDGYEGWYEVEVNRPKAANDLTEVTITAEGYVDADNANKTYTLPGALPTTGTDIKNSTKLTYNSKTASFKISVPSGSKTKILGSDGKTEITNNTQILTLEDGPDKLQKTFKFFVQTEYYQSQGTTGPEYTIIIEEAQPNGTKTIYTLEVKNS